MMACLSWLSQREQEEDEDGEEVPWYRKIGSSVSLSLFPRSLLR